MHFIFIPCYFHIDMVVAKIPCLRYAHCGGSIRTSEELTVVADRSGEKGFSRIWLCLYRRVDLPNLHSLQHGNIASIISGLNTCCAANHTATSRMPSQNAKRERPSGGSTEDARSKRERQTGRRVSSHFKYTPLELSRQQLARAR